MASNDLAGYFRKLDAIAEVNRKYPYRAAVIALNFTKDRFRQRNWIGDRTEPWPQRQLHPGGRATLVGKGSGALKRSYRIVRHNKSTAVLGSDKPYARAHNEGAKILITEQMRKLWWAKYYELSGNVTYSIKTRKTDKRGSRLIEQADYYKNLALTKKKYITIPKRQFSGESQYLTRQIERQMTADYAKALKS